MNGDAEIRFATPYNVVAAFPRDDSARLAVRTLLERGVPRRMIVVRRPGTGDSPEEVAEMRAEMQDELVNSWAAPAFLMTGPQANSAFWMTAVVTAVFLAVGLIVGASWAVFFDSALNPWGRVGISLVAFGVAGGTIGFLAGGSFQLRARAADRPAQDMDDLRTAAERDVLVAVHGTDRETVEAAAKVLRGVGAERVDLVDGAGTPLPPQHDHPRPADPSAAFWWKRAGHG